MTDKNIEECDKESLLYKISFNHLCKSKPVELFRLCYENDISIVDGAKIMKISPKTTEMHSAKFRLMMKANTMTTAVIRAINLGIIKKVDQDFELVKLTNRGTFTVIVSKSLR